MFRLFVVVLLFMTIDVESDRISLDKTDSMKHLPFILLYNFGNVFYCGTLFIGIPKQEFNVVFDTSSANLWVFSKNCSNPICLIHRRYNSTGSYTYISNNTKISMEHVNYNINGFLSTDTVNVANLHIKNQTFVEVVGVLNVNMFNFNVNMVFEKFDGLLGLSYSNISENVITTIFDNMIEQGLVSSRIFSFYLNRNTSTDLGGKLIFGGSDPAFYEGDFTYIPVTNRRYWQFTLDSIHINDFISCEKSCQVTVGLSAWQIIGPGKDISRINQLIGTDAYGGVDCYRISELPIIRFNMGGKTFDLTGDDYIIRYPYDDSICITVFWESDPKYDGEVKWILGMPFIGRYYTEFDMEKDRVGFALARTEE